MLLACLVRSLFSISLRARERHSSASSQRSPESVTESNEDDSFWDGFAERHLSLTLRQHQVPRARRCTDPLFAMLLILSWLAVITPLVAHASISNEELSGPLLDRNYETSHETHETLNQVVMNPASHLVPERQRL